MTRTSPADAQRYASSVRLPSHVDPPFKARQWSWASGLQISVGAPFPGIGVGHTAFSGSSSGGTLIPAGGLLPQPVPVGMRAEIRWIHVTALDLATGQTAVPPVIVATVVKNNRGTFQGEHVQGWTDFAMAYSTTIGSFELAGPSVPVMAPIHLVEGDDASLVVHMAFAGLLTTWAIAGRWGGWVYPLEIEGEAGTIRATQQDPGVRAPLGAPSRPY